MPILGDFAVKYGAFGSQLGVPTDDLYQALVDTAENTPDDWYEGLFVPLIIFQPFGTHDCCGGGGG